LKKPISASSPSASNSRPARRYSYLVGKNENCHTAQKQFLALLQTDRSIPLSPNWKAAFSVEKVTREFYEHYKDLFEQTRDALAAFLNSAPAIKIHFAERGIECDDFAKKLLGQIVFLYFLQKKGWFGVERGKSWGSGRKDFHPPPVSKTALTTPTFPASANVHGQFFQRHP
jgi:hypothetical protein